MSNVIKINKNPDHIKNIHRINRIHGQLKGVEKMIVEKRYCLEILQQTRAITSAIKSLENNILNKHIDHCVVDAMKKNEIAWPTLNIMILAIINGLITSIILETIILLRQSFSLRNAISTAFGMSFISMISMEIAMNVTDVILTGGAMLTWWVVPIMLFVGFITPWPYNYWRLKKYNIACH